MHRKVLKKRLSTNGTKNKAAWSTRGGEREATSHINPPSSTDPRYYAEDNDASGKWTSAQAIINNLKMGVKEVITLHKH